MNGIVDVSAGDASLNVLRHVPVRQTGMPGAPALQIEDAELAPLERGIQAEHLDDLLRVGAFLQFAEHQHLILMRAINAGLARRHAKAGHHHRLHAHQELIVLVHASGGRNDDAPGSQVHRNHGPGGGRRRRDQAGRDQGNGE